jgi:hypothetical protein
MALAPNDSHQRARDVTLKETMRNPLRALRCMRLLDPVVKGALVENLFNRHLKTRHYIIKVKDGNFV